MPRFVYVLPVHNEERLLADNVARLTVLLARVPGSEIELVENGSRDGSWAVVERLARDDERVPVRAFREADAGIGYAYHRGLTEALARFGPAMDVWAVLTAADLPFGASDLEAVEGALAQAPWRILMGSKAHRASVVQRDPQRRLMSALYRVARRAVVGMKVGDSRGSVFLRLDLAAVLVPRIEARGFFYSTELCHLAERAGESILEVPVTLEPSLRASTVRPAADSVTMARALWRLRSR